MRHPPPRRHGMLITDSHGVGYRIADALTSTSARAPLERFL